ncbi:MULTISPECIES: porin [Aequorivita]|uniref:Porin n=1 Tax=Aequorivita iocasae TaxID=2803865 RepID=A0ABX7DVI7_9FLAO|nr:MULTISPECIES: porin [Aequorivita]QQX77802.1 porin [Aequorivita iocasae]UCA57302.1 OprO/OprP family phosphate-selective porin [Aequorivita sp. F7]
MRQKNIFFIGFLFLCVSIGNSQIDIPKFGEGMFNIVGKDSTWSVRFAPRIQVRANSFWDHEADKFGKPEHSFLIRRARLKFDGFAYSPKLRYKIELGLSNQDISGASEFTGNSPRIIYDAVVMWEFYKNLELWAGQTKLPGNRERVISSANLQLIDRSRLNSIFNIDRDLGIQLRHRFYASEKFLIREMFAVSQGEGRNVITGNLGGLQYTSRIELLPFGEFIKKGDYIGGDIYREKTPKLAIGATYDLNVDAVKTRSNQGSYMRNDIGFYETNISTIFIDAMFKYNGFSLMGEYSYRDAENPIATNSDGAITGNEVYTGQGFNIQGGYVFKTNWEVAGRFTAIVPDNTFSTNDTENQFTLGGSKYIVGHKLKVQTDLTYSTIGGESNFIEYRMGFDLHF